MRKVGKVVFSDGSDKIETEIFYDGKKLSVDLSEIRKFLSRYDGSSNIILDIAFDVAKSLKSLDVSNVKFDSKEIEGRIQKQNLKALKGRKIFYRNELYSILVIIWK